MRKDEGMGWSWPELMQTPPYVKRFCIDFLGIRARVQSEKAELERRRQQRGR